MNTSIPCQINPITTTENLSNPEYHWIEFLSTIICVWGIYNGLGHVRTWLFILSLSKFWSGIHLLSSADHHWKTGYERALFLQIYDASIRVSRGRINGLQEAIVKPRYTYAAHCEPYTPCLDWQSSAILSIDNKCNSLVSTDLFLNGDLHADLLPSKAVLLIIP